MSEAEMQHWLAEAIIFRAQEAGAGVDVMSFDAACLLTKDKGLVVRLGGSEFQLTIIRSR